MKLLRDTDTTIADIAARVGYETQGKFSKAFKDVTQMLPSEYRKIQYGK
ncbi:helix-turn-helix domain-containing protein [Pseudoflavonifractor sp. CLA-AP-H29]|uniref:Helix-turn-helix domain-containing protein n=1 Tax=Pseudoflavonifractor intestinihominis TaxID=3133171 RepID=A0ABV1E8V6_9FIRM